jgi:hypothetical protein
MQIHFKKQKNKPPTLHITRADKSETWMVFKHNLIQHDLVHFVAETVLKWENGFYDLIAKGANIEDFETTNRAERPDLALASIQMEYIVNLLETEIYQQQVFEDFNAQLTKNCQGNGHLPPSSISDADLKKIRLQIKDLLQQWQAVKTGESLELEF